MSTSDSNNDNGNSASPSEVVAEDSTGSEQQQSGDVGKPAAEDDESQLKELSSKDLHTRFDWAEGKHRNPHDTDIEWLHRKAFLAAHVGRYPLNRLLALASCYANSVVLGCRYPQGVMTELHRVEEDTIRAVEALLSSNDKYKHLHGVRRLSSGQQHVDDDGDSKSPPQHHQQRPQWFNDLAAPKSAT